MSNPDSEYQMRRYHSDPKFKKKWLSRVKGYAQTTIPKGQLCQSCNSCLATQRHHYDYNKPLDVLFVCRKCHVKLDNGSVVVNLMVIEKNKSTITLNKSIRNEERRAYEKFWKRTFRERINESRRERYAHDEEFRVKERERIKKAYKPWAEKTEQEKERKRVWQRDYMRRRYNSDPAFRVKQRERVRKSSTGFMRFAGGNYGKKGGKAGNDKRVQISPVSRLSGTAQASCEVCGERAGLVKHLGSSLKEKLFLCQKCHRKYPHMNHESFKRIKKGGRA